MGALGEGTQRLLHRLVGHLPEVVVKLPDRCQCLWGMEANDVIGNGAQILTNIARADGNGRYQASRPLCA